MHFVGGVDGRVTLTGSPVPSKSYRTYEPTIVHITLLVAGSCLALVPETLALREQRNPALLESDDTEVVVAAGVRLRQVRVRLDEGCQDVVARIVGGVPHHQLFLAPLPSDYILPLLLVL